MRPNIPIRLAAPRLVPLLALLGCGPTEVLVGDAPGVARVVAGVLGVTYEIGRIDTAVTGDARTVPLGSPAGLAASEDGSFYFADRFRRRIGHVTAGGALSWPVGRGACRFPGLTGSDPLDACLAEPTAVALVPGGDLLIADREAHAVYRLVVPAGRIERVFGDGTSGMAAAGAVATDARTGLPAALAVGPNGAVYVAESANNRVVRIDLDGIVTPFAGSGQVGDAGDGGPAPDAALRRPEGLAWSGDTLYVADSGNHRVRRVVDGVIEAFAGIGAAGYAGDRGPVAGALFGRPGQLAVLGTLLFVADRDNHRVRLVRIGPDSIDTFGGTGRTTLGGDLMEIGRTAIIAPAGLAAAGRAIFIADSGAYVVRRVIR